MSDTPSLFSYFSPAEIDQLLRFLRNAQQRLPKGQLVRARYILDELKRALTTPRPKWRRPRRDKTTDRRRRSSA
jgi:hypothetical protein